MRENIDSMPWPERLGAAGDITALRPPSGASPGADQEVVAARGERSHCAGDVQAEGGHGKLSWDESGPDGAELPGGEPGPGVAGDAAGNQRGY
jgi:hypothetical protein